MECRGEPLSSNKGDGVDLLLVAIVNSN